MTEQTVASNVTCELTDDDQELFITCTAKTYHLCLGNVDLKEVYTAMPFIRKGKTDQDLWKVGRHAATSRNQALLELLNLADRFCVEYDVSL